MQASKHYSKAPLTEAIIDFKVVLPGNVTTDTLSNIHLSIEDTFPAKEEIHQSSIMLQPGLETPISTDQQLFGFLFRSVDRSKIFQVTLNSFTFNRLAPYTSWEELRADAKYVWEIYKSIIKPETVTRVAIRFVNRFELPSTTSNLKTFLRIAPDVPPNLPQSEVSNFFMQLLVPQEDCQLIISEAIVPPSNPETLSVILDFDLFREQVWRSDDDGIWQYLEKLRVLKNAVFEASITDETRRLIE
jgi:uncharacterized protein (TIGR04255 family)